MSEFLSVFWDQQPAGTAISILIAALVLAGAADIVSALVWLARQRRSTKHARKALPPALTGEKLDSEAKLGRLLGIGRSTFLNELLDHIQTLRRAGLGYQEVVRRRLQEQVFARGGHARYITTILTVLGLLGTVIGMSLAMVRISGAFRLVDDPSALSDLTSALSGTLEGMKAAFACTLAGLSGSVLLSLGCHALRRRQRGFVADLEDFAFCEFVPRLERVDPEADQASKAFANVLAGSTQQLTELSDSLSSSAEKYRQAGDVVKGAVEALSKRSKEFGDKLVSIQDLTQLISNAAQAVTELSRVAESDLKHAREDNALKESSLAAQMETLQEVLKEVQASARRRDDAFQEWMQANSERFEAALKKMIDGVAEHHQDSVAAKLDQHSKVLGALFEEYSAKLRSFADMMIEIHLDGRAASLTGEPDESIV